MLYFILFQAVNINCNIVINQMKGELQLKLIQFRFKNFRGIDDSGTFDISEHGITQYTFPKEFLRIILLAIEKIYPNRFFVDDDVITRTRRTKAIIDYIFRLKESDVRRLEDEFGALEPSFIDAELLISVTWDKIAKKKKLNFNGTVILLLRDLRKQLRMSMYETYTYLRNQLKNLNLPKLMHRDIFQIVRYSSYLYNTLLEKKDENLDEEIKNMIELFHMQATVFANLDYKEDVLLSLLPELIIINPRDLCNEEKYILPDIVMLPNFLDFEKFFLEYPLLRDLFNIFNITLDDVLNVRLKKGINAAVKLLRSKLRSHTPLKISDFYVYFEFHPDDGKLSILVGHEGSKSKPLVFSKLSEADRYTLSLLVKLKSLVKNQDKERLIVAVNPYMDIRQDLVNIIQSLYETLAEKNQILQFFSE